MAITAIAAPEPDDDRTRRITRADRLRRRGLPVPDDDALVEFRQRVRRPNPVAADVAAWMNAPALVVSPAPPVEDEPEPPEPTEKEWEAHRQELVRRQRGTPSAVTALAIWTPPRKAWLASLAGWLYFALRLNRVGQPLNPKPFALFTAWTVLVVLGLNLFLGGRG